MTCGAGWPRLERLRASGATSHSAVRLKGKFSCGGPERCALPCVADAFAGHDPVLESSLKAINELLRIEPELPVTRTRGRYSMEFKPARSRPPDPMVPEAKAVAELLVNAKSGTIKKCANPACILYFDNTTKITPGSGSRRPAAIG
jgi:hypothetical protein